MAAQPVCPSGVSWPIPALLGRCTWMQLGLRCAGLEARILCSRVEGWQEPGSSGASVVRRNGK